MAIADDIARVLKVLENPALPAIDLGLERVEKLLHALGDPQKSLPPVVHVAGTNGKGSLLAFLTAIFQVAGFRVHRLTSPFLVRFNEQIMLEGETIGDAALLGYLERVERAAREYPATFFEATAAAAFLAFSEHPADILLLETGLGGRLDATNMSEKPALTAITPISLDHCEFLGDTLEKIAGEKAGILKPGVPCVVGSQAPGAMRVIEARATELGVPLFRFGTEWQVNCEEDGVYYQSARLKLLLKPSLVGDHQFTNAATAVACVEQLGFDISPIQIEQGIASAEWPARLQRLKSGRWADMLSAGSELWLDGAHNPDGGKALAAWMREKSSDWPVYMVCGMLANKDVREFLSALRGAVECIFTVEIPAKSQSLSASQLQVEAERLGFYAQSSDSLEQALQKIDLKNQGDKIVVIAGSLYLAGYVLSEGR